MSRFLQLLGIIGIAIVQVQSTVEFNCLRTSDDCAADTCGPTGDCACVSPNGLYNCGTDVVNVGTGCGCVGTGSICNLDGTTCACTEKFYGPQCQYKTLDVSCSKAGSHILNVNVPGTPTCYVKGFESTCSFSTTVPTGAPTGWMGDFLEASLTDATNCGSPTETTDSDGVVTKCFTVICRYESLYLTGLDFEAQFCCGDAKRTVTSEPLTLSNTGLSTTDVNADAAGADVVTVAMKDGSDAAIAVGSTVDIGSTVKLEFTLDSTSDFAAIRVLSCKAQDDASNEVEFIANSCPTKTFVQGTSRTDGSPVVIQTQAIRFTGSTIVSYECSVLICRQMAECAEETCSDGTSGFGRKKREITASSNSTEQKTVVTYVRVNDPFTASEVKSAVQDAVKQTGAINLSAAVIGLAVVVLVLLGACLVLGVCLINRRAPVKNMQG